MPAKIDVPSKEEIQKVYSETLSCLKVAEHFGVCKKTALAWMKGYGIQRVTRKLTKTLRGPVLRFLREGNRTAEEVAEALCVSVNTVNRICRELGHPAGFDTFHPGHIVTHNGYKMIRMLNHPYKDAKGYVREHVLIMEDYLGRYVLPDEVVHHIDGDKLNNNIENLELCTLAAHTSWHHRKI